MQNLGAGAFTPCSIFMGENMNYKITDEFWHRYRELVRTQMIPYQWDVLNDAADIKIERERNDDSIPNEKSHAIENFKVAAGLKEGTHYGWVFQDSDVYKWLEAVAYSLADSYDAKLKETADEVVKLIASAQEPDGYLSTFFTIEAPDRKFKRLGESHELYCAGHYMEAAVAYYESTGERLCLDTAEKLASCIDSYFGPEEGKIHGYDGHEEVEIGLMRLYFVTGNKKYLKLARYFILERGKNPDFFRTQYAEDGKEPVLPGISKFPDTYYQNHKPVKMQDTAEGHAVRLVYLCTAMADVARETDDKELLDACKKIWKNITERRMYITGGIGSTVIGESFTLDYDLPNDTMYCETCAAVGMVFLADRMLKNDADSKYADVMERALYNSALSGMALDGKHFFYVNPLEVVPEKSKKDPTKSHVKAVRPDWLGCACCPPNLARLITSLEKYIYTKCEDSVLINLFIDSECSFEYEGGTLTVKQEVKELCDRKVVTFTTSFDGSKDIKVGIRIPDWCSKWTVGSAETIGDLTVVEKGYLYINDIRDFHGKLTFFLQPERRYASLKVSEDAGKVSVCRGPFVYCLEEADNGNDLHLVKLPENAVLHYNDDDTLLGGVGTITVKGERCIEKGNGPLYSKSKKNQSWEPVELKFIPYFAWGNRGANEMRVWIRE